ncbi:MAG: hypothetical protein RL641_940 [Candidatus Parcubacteria bacterium]|jgi:hypothetical protein
MNKLLGWIVLVVIVAGGVWYFIKNKPSDIPNDKKETQSSNSEKVAQENIPEFIKSGKSYHCTTAMDLPGGQVGAKMSTDYYFANGKMRIESVMSSPGIQESQKTYMIFNKVGEYVYTWSSGTSMGTKMKQDMELGDEYKKLINDRKAGAPTQYTPPDLTCASWQADISLFTPPANIQFQDMTDLMKGNY